MGNSPWLNFPASILAAGGAIALQLRMPYRLLSETGVLPGFLHPHRAFARKSVSEVQLL
ncbi:hypothetical protein [Laspinema olomoucense]|uniref:Uncharacterized protein n=1 Tax=Laspinema olomoucense D3b TaxID=2953688 RepID=A0ABT2NFQ8_9CYAN|nr:MULTISPECIES: hypothetical protein [unclassified Laspinema]MCT7981331.1 hypothetical protein [Laspinema sp. D3b]MCT7990893.1 hypothetical protein [Laspinema sp. D3a]